MRTPTTAEPAPHRVRRLITSALAAFLATVGFAGPAAATVETGTISGTFRTAAGNPIGDARVQAINAVTGYPETAATTVQDGTYALHVRGGAYLLKFIEPDRVEQYSPQRTKMYQAARYAVTVGATVTVDETAIARGDIAGRLVDAAGAPAAGSEVTLYPAGDGEDYVFAGTTGADGRFRTSRVPAGRYRVSFTLPRNRKAVQYVPRKLNLADATAVEVTAELTTTVDERLLRTGVIAGQVLTADCRPLAAYVGLYGPGGESAGYMPTDTAGAFRFEVFPGKYRIGFRWADFSRSQYFTGAQTLETANAYRVAAGQELALADRADTQPAAVRTGTANALTS